MSAAQSGVFESHKRLYVYPAFSVSKRAMVDLAPAVDPDTGAQFMIYNPPTSYIEDGLLELHNATVTASNLGGKQIVALTGFTGRSIIDPSRGEGGEPIDLAPLEEHAVRIASRLLAQSPARALVVKGLVVYIGINILARHGRRLGVKIPPFYPLARYGDLYATHPAVFALLSGIRLEPRLVPIVVGKPARTLTQAQLLDLIIKVADEMGTAQSEAVTSMKEVAEVIVEKVAARGVRVDIDDIIKAIGLGMERAFEAAVEGGGPGRGGGRGRTEDKGSEGKETEGAVNVEEIAESTIANLLA